MSRLLAQLDALPADTVAAGRSSYKPPRRRRGLPGIRSVATLLGWVILIGLVVYLARLGDHHSKAGASTAPDVSDSGSSSRQLSSSIEMPKPGVGEHLSRLLPAPAIPAGAGGYAFTHMNGKVPVAYDSCRPIHYVIREQNAPAGGDTVIREAVAAASRATGLQFIDDGISTEFPSQQRASYQPTRYGDRWAPVLIAWTSPTEVKELAGNVDGYGGSNWVWADGGSKNLAFVTGGVFLDTPDLTGEIKAHGLRQALLPLVEHELGHVLGLGHVDDPSEIMNPVSGGLLAYGPGDLRGLAQLGRGSCHPEL